jgi:dinuclear metal center YbgI/SA1388 family protein
MDVVLTVADVTGLMAALYPPEVAADWDSNGLIAGDPAALVRRVLFAVDPVLGVVDEAIAGGYDLVVTHHPLFLRGTQSVAANTYKGAVVHRLIQAGIALYNAHTNADASPRGVAAALADLIGVVEQQPLVVQAVAGAEVGSYGIGRVGLLPRVVTLGELASELVARIPVAAQGARVSGDLSAPVQRVAVVGGSGDSLFDAVRAAAADVYITADLRHHPASEFRERALFEDSGRPFLIDVAHFASEWPWLPYAAQDLATAAAAEIAARGGTGSFICEVSTANTDPWDTVISKHD